MNWPEALVVVASLYVMGVIMLSVVVGLLMLALMVFGWEPGKTRTDADEEDEPDITAHAGLDEAGNRLERFR